MWLAMNLVSHTLGIDIMLGGVQVVIFVKNAERAQTLAALLEKCQFPATHITARMDQKSRLDVYRWLSASTSQQHTHIHTFTNVSIIGAICLVMLKDVCGVMQHIQEGCEAIASVH